MWWMRKQKALSRLDDDIRDHIEREVEENIARGMAPAEARRQALLTFGNVRLVREDTRAVWRWTRVEQFAQNVRFALRTLRRDAGFACIAVFTLGLGIGVNVTVFTLVNGALFRDLPFDEPDRIVTVGTLNQRAGNRLSGVSVPDLRDWQAATRTFAGLGSARQDTMNVADEGHAPERLLGAYVSANTFRLLGEQPALGRDFRPEDDQPGAVPVVVLGHDVWRNRYQSDSRVVGRAIRVNGVQATVIGIMREGFGFPETAQLWQPLALLPAEMLTQRALRTFEGFGRLAPGATLESANADLAVIADALTREHPVSNSGFSPRVRPYRERSIGGPLVVVMSALMGAVAFVLLIACANVANMLLARVANRTREMSVRAALGASRWHIISQLLTESLVLACGAGILGLAFAAAGVRAFWSIAVNSSPPFWLRFPLDGVVFTFCAAACCATALLFGLVPALRTSNMNLVSVINESGRGSSSGASARQWAGGLVVGQITLTLVLLTGAALMMRNFLSQYGAETGVQTAGLVTMRLDLTARDYGTAERRLTFARRFDDRLNGVSDLVTTLATSVPGGGAPLQHVRIEGRPTNDEPHATASTVRIGPRYFEVLGTEPPQGRSFTEQDGPTSLPIALVNERFASLYLPGEDAIGRRIQLTDTSLPGVSTEWLTIVGVAPNVRQRGTEDFSFDPVVYVPYAQNPAATMALLARSTGDLSTVAARLRSEVSAVDPDLPLSDLRTMDEWLWFQLWPLRVFGSMFGIFAGVALVLATVGVYAVSAYAVTQRTREIGLRVALGARTTEIGWLIVKQSTIHLGIGLMLGGAGAIAVGQLLRGVLIGTQATDPATLIGVAVLLTLVVVGACVIPTRRAMRVDPVVALRHE